VTYFAATSDEQWTVPLTGISVDGTDIGVSTKNLYTFVDTGDSYVAYVPTDIFKAIGSALGSGGDGDRTVLPVGCNSEKTIEFNIGGDAFKLTPDQWLSSELGGSGCHINIKSHKEDS
jgi:hypothetical protein